MIEEIMDTYPDDQFLKAAGFDDAIIGVDEKSMRLIYSVYKCILILKDRDKMSYEEALEFLEFNTKDAYMGEKTPIWCEDNF